jgi:glutamate-1-semialdehyde 2,1-aminomutase
MEIYLQEPVVDRLHAAGERLRAGIEAATRARGLDRHIAVMGRACNLFYATHDAEGQPSQAYRALFLQETIRRGVLMPSLVVSYSHTDDDIARTVEAVDGALEVYARALEDGVEQHLMGPPTCHVFDRRW